jgi:CheY-like chemotaxis protein
LEVRPSKVLILLGQSPVNTELVRWLKSHCQAEDVDSIDAAIEKLRHEHFDGIFSDSADFLPLERALVSQQASLILNNIGEGVCVVDGEGHCNWMNRKMQAWPERAHKKIWATCKDAYELFTLQMTPPVADRPDAPIPPGRSKRYVLNIEEQQYMEMICSPVISPAGQVVQVAAVVWDSTGMRRLQQKIDAIDKAGSELCRLEADAMSKLNVGQRLKLLEDKIIAYSRDLMHFDHFTIRVLDRKTNKLELVISVGLPTEATEVELYATAEGNGISGYVAASGRSYICPDVQRDPRYVLGLDHAQSSLTVPLRLYDKVIGIFNIESQQRAGFNEDDRQIAEIFGRYVAIALNVLNLMVVERVETSHKVAGDVCSEVAGPLNDIASDASALMDDYIGNDDLRNKLHQIMGNVQTIRHTLRSAADGTCAMVLGVGNVHACDDPILASARILVADDDPNIRHTISDVLRKYKVQVTVAASGGEAISLMEQQPFDLVISDISMPDKNGYEVFAAARRKHVVVPVILMTGFGYDPNHSIVRASQEGLQAVLFKPFKVELFLQEVRKALQAVAGKK